MNDNKIILNVEGVHQWFGDQRVLHDINLQVIQGEFVAIVGPSGCHLAGQAILMYDGSVKNVEDIMVGEELMGTDSTPRKVLSLVKGRGEMYKIIPNKGQPFVVSNNHILSLRRMTRYDGPCAAEIVDVEIMDWLSWSQNRKNSYKLFRAGVNFDSDGDLPIAPYFLGLLLGDGSFRGTSPSMHSLDFEVISETIRQSKIWGLKISFYLRDTSKVLDLRLVGKKNHKNKLTTAIKGLGLWGHGSKTKFVPRNYLVSSRANRLAILAGLIDTDGDYNGCFGFTSTSEQLCEDVIFLSRSLGFAAYKSGPFTKKSQNGTTCECWRTTISGDLNLIPTRVSYKKASKRKQKKSVLMTGFSVLKLDVEDYHGFVVDGDNRYLMGDFTVTHNCGKTTLFNAILGTCPAKKGIVETAGQRVTGPNRNVGVVYQRYGLYQFLTALENVTLGPMLDQSEWYQRWFLPWWWWPLRKKHLAEAEALLTKVKLGKVMKNYPCELSGGQQQRVAIAQSLIMRPHILLLDEPFGALDESTRESLQKMLLHLYRENVEAKKLGQDPPWTVLFITHELNEAFYVSDRVVGLSRNWFQTDEKGRITGESLGATKVWDKSTPTFEPEAPKNFDVFYAAKQALKDVVLDDKALAVERNQHVSFFDDLAKGVGSGVAILGK